MEERPIYLEDQTGFVRYAVRHQGIKRIFSPGIDENELTALIRRFSDVMKLDRFVGILDEEQVFDLVGDPGEMRNLLASGEESDGNDYFKAMLGKWMAFLRATKRQTGSGGTVDPKELERLRELGYQTEPGEKSEDKKDKAK